MLQTSGQEQENAVIAHGKRMVREALEKLGLPPCAEMNDHTLQTTLLEKPYKIYISPFGPQYLQRVERTVRVYSSSHCIVFVWPTTSVEDVAALLEKRTSGIKRGQESEEIARIALGRVVKKRPELFADAYKTGDRADIDGHDFRVGIWPHATRRIYWWGLQIKSSQAGKGEAIRKWGEERAQRNRPASPQERGLWRRIVCVPQEGDKEERIRITMERIVAEAEYIRERV